MWSAVCSHGQLPQPYAICTGDDHHFHSCDHCFSRRVQNDPGDDDGNATRGTDGKGHPFRLAAGGGFEYQCCGTLPLPAKEPHLNDHGDDHTSVHRGGERHWLHWCGGYCCFRKGGGETAGAGFLFHEETPCARECETCSPHHECCGYGSACAKYRLTRGGGDGHLYFTRHYSTTARTMEYGMESVCGRWRSHGGQAAKTAFSNGHLFFFQDEGDLFTRGVQDDAATSYEPSES